MKEVYKDTTRDTLQTGDLILFYGESFISKAISIGSSILKFRFKASPSHLGVVVKSQGGPLLLFESTTLSKTPTYYGNVLKEGPQLVSLSSRIKSFKGKVTFRKLMGVEMTLEMEEDLERYRKRVHERVYEKSFWEIARAALGSFRLPWSEKEDDSSIFCSELVTDLYKLWKLLAFYRISNRYAPIDYADNGRVERLLQGKVKLAPEVELC